MNTFEQNTADFKEVNAAAFDFFRKTSQPWVELIDGSFIRSGDGKESGSSGVAAEMMKLWSKGFLNLNAQKAGVKKILAAGMEQQKLCSNLTTSWFTCATKMIEAIGNGTRNNEVPAEVVTACKDLASDYRRSCTTFIDSEWALFFDALRFQGPGEEKSEKPETIKSTLKTEKRVKVDP